MANLDSDLQALQEVRDFVERAERATHAMHAFDQARTDAACRALVEAAARHAADLARSAVEETGIGRVHDKIQKNLFASEAVWESIADEKTVGIVRRDEERGVIELATPSGVVAGIVPTTNPTSTAIHNALISIKGRNAIVLSPHPRAKRCVGETVDVMREALGRVGAPPDLVLALSSPTIESTASLMSHPKTAVILATGGEGLVNAAYSSGKPAYGVGPGNVPVYIDRSADVDAAARWLVASQSFDNATLCCSEQALVLDRPIADAMLSALQGRGAHLCSEEETRLLEKLCNRRGHMNPDVVGLDPHRVTALAGFEVPCSTTLLLAHQDGVGREHPLSIEILCPLLSVHVVDGWEQGCKVSTATLHYGGLGHTIGLWANDEKVLGAWFMQKPAGRIIVNGPTAQGAVGYSTQLDPSMSLGCGPQAGNITSDNITARHLVNLKRAAFPRHDWEATYVRFNQRAASLGGERAPRGTGIPGDPGLTAAAATQRTASNPGSTVSAPLSNWRGNPPVFDRQRTTPGRGASTASVARAAQAAAATSPGSAPPGASAEAANPGAGSAPRFTAPSAPRTSAPPAGRAGARAAATPKCAGESECPGPYVGMALTPAEIQGILAHAGTGCSTAPCQDCPNRTPGDGAGRA